MWKKLSLQWKLVIPIIGGLLLFGITVALVSQMIVTEQVKVMAREKAQSDLNTLYALVEREYPGPWRIENSVLFKGAEPIDHNHGIVDWLGDLTGNTVTVFRGDTRVATNVMDEGRRAVGTQAAAAVTKEVLVNGREYLGEAVVVGVSYQTAYKPLQAEDGTVIGMFYTGASQALIDDVISAFNRGLMVVSIVAILVLSVLLLVVTRHSITKPINNVSSILHRMSELDLHFDETSEAMAYLERSDEIGAMTRALAAMQKSLRGMVQSLLDVAQNVAGTSENLAAAAQQNSATIEEVASSAATFSQSVADAQTLSNHMQKDAQHIGQLSGESVGKMDHTRQSMDSIVAATDEVKTTLSHLAGQAQNMERILELIAKVADQTNLLALNAAIEAARAGEHGRGFAVVAEEVRTLAEQTQRSVDDINGMIGSLVSSANDSVQTMNEAQTHTHSGSEQVASTQTSFAEISNRITDTIQQIQRMAQSIASMAEASDSIAAAAQEQAASMEEVAGTTQNLAGMSGQLREIVQRFRV